MTDQKETVTPPPAASDELDKPMTKEEADAHMKKLGAILKRVESTKFKLPAPTVADKILGHLESIDKSLKLLVDQNNVPTVIKG